MDIFIVRDYADIREVFSSEELALSYIEQRHPGENYVCHKFTVDAVSPEDFKPKPSDSFNAQTGYPSRYFFLDYHGPNNLTEARELGTVLYRMSDDGQSAIESVA